MFLRQADELERLLGDTSAARSELLKAQNNPDEVPQVMALEPSASAVPQDQFYLMPIFEARESFDENGQPLQLLNVASIDPGSSARSSEPKAAGMATSSDAFRTAVVLVVDTSVSSSPISIRCARWCTSCMDRSRAVRAG